MCVCESDTEGPETSPISAAALLLGCWGDMKDGGGETEAFPWEGGRLACWALAGETQSAPVACDRVSPDRSPPYLQLSPRSQGRNRDTRFHQCPSFQVLLHSHKLTGTMTSSGAQWSYIGEPGPKVSRCFLPLRQAVGSNRRVSVLFPTVFPAHRMLLAWPWLQTQGTHPP